MYNSGYSHVKRYSPEAQKRMQYRSKGKSCGYYMRIVFFFSSLIQSLIIVSLVLFLVYGKKQDSASTGQRIESLEESFSRLSIENVALREQRKNLTNLLNATLTSKARIELDLLKLRYLANLSLLFIQDFERKLQLCNNNPLLCKNPQPIGCPPIISTGPNACGMLGARLQLMESNFTQTMRMMRRDMEQTAKERDYINLEAIRLRRDKSTLQKELDFYRRQSKDDFSLSLSGVSNVSKAFLKKIESLFPAHIAFQITCPKQREHLEQIRTNCTSLSREVEDKLQGYLNSVGDQVSGIQGENNHLKAENWRLSEDYRWCSKNRTGLIQEHKQNLDQLQLKHDKEKEKLLVEKEKQNGKIDILEHSVNLRNSEVAHLTEQIKQLNVSCMSRTGFGGFSGGSVSRVNPWNQPGSTGSGGLGSSFGSFGSVLNKPGSGTSSIGSALSKPRSNEGAFSNTGSAPSSPNLGSGGIASYKPALNARGSSTIGTASGSIGSSSSLSSSGIGLTKPSSSVRSSSGFGSSPESAGSASKTGSTSSAISWFGFGSSNSGSSKTGGGTSYGGTGSSFGAGRMNGQGGGTTSLAQHLQDLQRIINASGPQEKQNPSRMLG
uniref:Plasmalemma vesicle associated protein a n=1 Tax=Monopterus albus TaxID=43700 RepID=A0A3Q3ILF9_MONAL|nr:keratin, type II cytoskeletal 2 epidermal-like [Monopterus albus]